MFRQTELLRGLVPNPTIGFIWGWIPLMVKSRLDQRLEHVHIVIDDVRDVLQDCRNNCASTGASGYQKRATVLEDHGWRHRTECPLARLNGVGFPANKPIGVW